MADRFENDDLDDYLSTQWTPAAKHAYEARGRELIATLQQHLEATAARVGRPREDLPYLDSLDRVRDALSAVNDAEFAWCGTALVYLPTEGLDDEEPEDDEGPEGPILSVLHRADYRITDEAAVIAAGRAAFLRMWPHEDVIDAAAQVGAVAEAAVQIADEGDLAALADAPGLELVRDLTVNVVHDEALGDDWDDPFGLYDRR